MLPGPVFQVELLTSARQKRYYVIRVLYVLALLVVIWQTYVNSFGWAGAVDSQPTNRLSMFARSCFESFAWTQGLVLLFLTPAIVSGVIADERQRKTLHYLLASQLTSSEIVLGKLLARLLHLAVVMALGIPVMSLLTLFGGIDPVELGAVYLGTASTCLALGGIAVAVSAVAKKVRDAILGTYLVGLLWMVTPILIAEPFRMEWPRAYALLEPINSVFLSSTPIGLAANAGTGRVLGSSFTEQFAWMVGLQLLGTVLLVAIATVRLRPSFRNEGGRRRRLLSLPVAKGRRLWNRPPCGDDPMLWKERHAPAGGLVTRVAGAIVWAGLVAGFAYGLYEYAPEAVAEILDHGYGLSTNWNGSSAINGLCRLIATSLYVIAGLGAAAAAASSVSGEREGDTWISLITTDLTGEEILRAKMFGAVWAVRWFLVAILLVLLISLILGGLHPFGFLAGLVQTFVFFWFATAIGTYFSIVCRNSARSLLWTIGTVVFLNGGYLILALLFYDDSPIIAFGCTPFVYPLSLVSFSEVWQLVGFNTGNWGGQFTGPNGRSFFLTCILCTFTYALAAAILTARVFDRFDRLVDRPRRSSTAPLQPAASA